MGALKSIMLGPDARGPRGMYSRGKAIYGAGRHASKAGPINMQAAIQRRLKKRGNNRGA
jgi:hypothetical protein